MDTVNEKVLQTDWDKDSQNSWLARNEAIFLFLETPFRFNGFYDICWATKGLDENRRLTKKNFFLPFLGLVKYWKFKGETFKEIVGHMVKPFF
jgi:hypothetical protein